MDAIVQHADLLFYLAWGAGLYLCWGIGANDVANAMGPTVGSGALSIGRALLLAALFEFAGAVLAGEEVTQTIERRIVSESVLYETPHLVVLGMLSSLLASAIWLMLASKRGWPVSTTHTVVGAVLGFALLGLDRGAVAWEEVVPVFLGWVGSPVLGGVLAFLTMVSIRRLVLNTPRPLERAKQLAPLYAFLVGWILSLIVLLEGLRHMGFALTPATIHLVALGVGGCSAVAGRILVGRIHVESHSRDDSFFTGVENVFTPMMILSGCAMAFAHGSNDVANGVGPMVSVLHLLEFIRGGGEGVLKPQVSLHILAIGATVLVAGLLTFGYQVMRTVGHRITELTPTRGFAATFAAAITVVLASRVGLPVSTTHVAVGAVVGVGLARGIGALDLRVLGGILVSWVVTVPVGGLLSAALYFLLKGVFG